MFTELTRLPECEKKKKHNAHETQYIINNNTNVNVKKLMFLRHRYTILKAKGIHNEKICKDC